MSDIGGDGWNGGVLTLSLNGVDSVFSLTEDMGNGRSFTTPIHVNDGDILQLGYAIAPFPEEVSFSLIDADCNIIYSYGPSSMIAGDSIFGDTVICPNCIAPNMCESITANRLRATSVDISYSSVSSNSTTYLIEYDTLGFTPGTGNILTTTDTIFRVQPLIEFTNYDIYVSTVCGQDTSIRVGPLQIKTPYTNDLGISLLTDPLSGCDLSAEEIRFGITNFGGTPQSFIKIGATINDRVLNINYPSDGFYTGVVGVDSTEFYSLDLRHNFVNTGTYKVQLWTELEGDQDTGNDTLTTFVYSIETEDSYPYYQDFENGANSWTDQENDSNLSSWELGAPSGIQIHEASSGRNIWASNLSGNALVGETSYLYSPCFDLSTSETAPILSFDLINDLKGLESNLSLEVTTNGTDYFTVIDASSSNSLNWYNDIINNAWTEVFETTPAWIPSAIKLEDIANEPSVRFRFKLQTTAAAPTGEGVGIDNFSLTPQQEKDILAVSINGPLQACETTSDAPTISFFNLGNTPAENILLSYQVNEGEIITETFNETVAPFTQASYTFESTYDGSMLDVNTIKAWVNIEGDAIPQNDSTTTTIINKRALPLFVDFEERERSISSWLRSNNTFVQNAHNANSNVLYANLYENNSEMLVNSANYGPVLTGDSLIFDYRFVNFDDEGSSATSLQEGDFLSVDLIIDCGTTVISDFVRITSAEHLPTTEFTTVRNALPNNLEGRDIQLLITGKASSTSNFYLDIDNINIKRCPNSLNLETSITNSSNNSGNGSITIRPRAGISPFTYSWSNGDNDQTASNLQIGNYSVTVIDAQGCSDISTFSIISSSNEFEVSEFDGLSVYPNPTYSELNIALELEQAHKLQLQLYNQFGQVVHSENLGALSSFSGKIDISKLPSGIYFVRLSSTNKQKTIRVLKL